VRTFAARRWEGAAQIGQRLSKANAMQYGIVYRRVSIDENTLKIEPQLIPLFSQPVRVGLVSSTFVQDRRDDPLEPARGLYTSVASGVANRVFASQTDFFRLLSRNATFHPFRKDWVFARTLTFGWINDFGEKNIPLPERLFSGGATTHRGFPENQAGPRDPVTGFPVGGKAILINQFEVRFPLLGENVGAVLFHDAGNVYESLDKLSLRVRQRAVTDFNYMVHAAGAGIRYRTPIGPIRVDLAYSINPPAFIGFKGTREELLEGRGQRDVRQRINHFQFHFSLGQSF
jgi:outer membrane protein assembly factor BamA